MTFYGLDFSNSKLIGSSTFVDPQTVKSKFYREWNDLMKIERKKYNVMRKSEAKFKIWELLYTE